MAKLGTKNHTAGNDKIFKVDYSDWLPDGVTISGTPTVALSAIFTATVTDITITGVAALPSHQVTFMLSGGSVNEAFTLDVQVTDSRGEIKNDTLGFRVVAP